MAPPTLSLPYFLMKSRGQSWSENGAFLDTDKQEKREIRKRVKELRSNNYRPWTRLSKPTASRRWHGIPGRVFRGS